MGQKRIPNGDQNSGSHGGQGLLGMEFSMLTIRVTGQFICRNIERKIPGGNGGWVTSTGFGDKQMCNMCRALP